MVHRHACRARRRVSAAVAASLIATVVVAVTGCTPTATRIAPQPVPPSASACRSVVVAAGDIVTSRRAADRTGRIAARQRPDTVILLGDNQYPSGSLADYRSGFGHTRWGQLRARSRPVAGNHEYRTPRAAGYYTYFGVPPFYAYDLGCGWRAYALNSEIPLDDQLRWLGRDLTAHPGQPVLAYWHRPRWSSGTQHGNTPTMQPLWDAFTGRAGIVLSGHEHNYERFAVRDGRRAFVVGTGGSSRYPFGSPQPGSQRRLPDTPGVLRLDLGSDGGYTWRFLDTADQVLDHGHT